MAKVKTNPIKTDQEIYDDYICRLFGKSEMTDDVDEIEEVLLNCTMIHEVDFLYDNNDRPEALLLQLINQDGRIIMMDIGTGWEMDDPEENDFRIKIGYPKRKRRSK